MIRNVVENLLGEEAFNLDDILETRHNYIDFNRFMLRKDSVEILEQLKPVINCKGW